MNDVRAELNRKLSDIESQMAEMERPPAETGGISFGKRIGEGTSMAIDRMQQVAVHNQLREVRADVVQALAKLDDDTYGSCDVCGEPIPEGRLEARPWATRCVEHAAKA